MTGVTALSQKCVSLGLPRAWSRIPSTGCILYLKKRKAVPTPEMVSRRLGQRPAENQGKPRVRVKYTHLLDRYRDGEEPRG